MHKNDMRETAISFAGQIINELSDSWTPVAVTESVAASFPDATESEISDIAKFMELYFRSAGWQKFSTKEGIVVSRFKVMRPLPYEIPGEADTYKINEKYVSNRPDAFRRMVDLAAMGNMRVMEFFTENKQVAFFFGFRKYKIWEPAVPLTNTI